MDKKKKIIAALLVVVIIVIFYVILSSEVVTIKITEKSNVKSTQSNINQKAINYFYRYMKL